MKKFIITQNDAEQRLDKFFKKLLTWATRWLIYKLNRKWKIKVNWKKEDNEYKLKVWDEIKLFLNEKDFEDLRQETKIDNNLPENKKFLKKDIVYEDGDLLIANKNPFQNVHPWDHKSDEVSLIEQIHDYYAWKKDSLTFRPSLVHRLDRDTSGIILIAKKKNTLTKLASDFKNHKKIKKIYHALLDGKLSRKTWEIKKSLERIDTTSSQKVSISNQWKEAITRYKVLEEFVLDFPEWKKIFTLAEIEIQTWRMHQIRVHMQSLWASVVWDDRYWNQSLNHFLMKKYWIKRQMLHAFCIEFQHPTKNKNMKFTAKYKDDMKNFVEILKKENINK